LLQAAIDLPFVHFTFLWRGLFLHEITSKISKYGLEDRITVINDKVDVNQVLQTVHATILLAKRSDLVKAYPHSLMESLLAGKPVIVSRSIPMSDFIQSTETGLVLEQFDKEHLERALYALRDGYASMTRHCQDLSPSIFNRDRLFAQMDKIYRHAQSQLK